MLNIADLRALSAARLEDAQALFDAGRYDASACLCGYALELALKARICETLNWQWFLETRREFEGYRSFRTHDLDVLLYLSRVRNRIAVEIKQDWEVVRSWNSEVWYARPGHATEQSATEMMRSTQEILRALWSQ